MKRIRSVFPLVLSAGGSIAVGLGVLGGTLHYLGAMVAAATIAAFPFMGLLTAIACETWFASLQTLGVPPRNYVIALVAASIALAKLTGKASLIRWDERTRTLKNLVVVYLVLILVINMSWTNTTPGELVSTMRYILTRIVMGVLIAYVVVHLCDSERRIAIALDVIVVCLAVSAFVGVMQYFNIDYFWDLRLRLWTPDPENALYDALMFRKRIAGLAAYSIPFAYQLVSVFPLVLARLLDQQKTVAKIAYGLFAVSIGLAIPMTQARSAIVGAAAALTVFLWRSKLQTKLIALLACGLILGVVLSQERVQKRFSAQAERRRGTIPMIVMSIKMGLDNPLGVPRSRRKSLQLEYFDDVLDLEGAYTAVDQTSHNQFLNALVYYGFPGLILNIAFYIVLFGMGNSLLKDYRGREANLARAFVASFAGYVVHSLFHNAGPFVGDVYNWYIIGLFVAFYLKAMEYKHAAD